MCSCRWVFCRHLLNSSSSLFSYLYSIQLFYHYWRWDIEWEAKDGGMGYWDCTIIYYFLQFLLHIFCLRIHLCSELLFFFFFAVLNILWSYSLVNFWFKVDLVWYLHSHSFSLVVTIGVQYLFLFTFKIIVDKIIILLPFCCFSICL